MKWYVTSLKMKVEIGGISTQKLSYWENNQEQTLTKK